MTFRNPAALWLGLLAVPVVVLHLLRPRRTARTVSSTYLWRELAVPVSAASPWQRLRPSTLLVLQLLAVALLAVAAAGPTRPTEAPLAQHTVFVVDTSGSMAALDGDPDRLATAKQRARELRAGLPAGGVASLVEAGPRPRVVLSASPDAGAFADALGRLATTAAGADFATAFTLAESLETPGVDIGFVLLSDGGLTDVERRQLPPGTRYERAGERATNRALARLGVEPRGSGLVARVTVRNTGGGDARQTLRLDVDGRTVHRVELDLPAGEAVDQAVELPAGDRVEAFLEGEDLLAADDHLRAVAARRRPLRVLVAGPGDVFLDRLLDAIPDLTVERVAEPRTAEGFDLAVYDGVPVPDDPGAPFLAIAPPGGAPGIEVAGEAERPAVALVRGDDPLLAGIDLSEVAVSRAQRLETSPGDVVLVGSEETPLLVRGRRHGRPFAYLGFALAETNLPVQVAFPILGDRLVAELAGAALAPDDLEVGDALPLARGRGATVEGPGGTRAEVAPGDSAPAADRPGFWVVTEEGRPPRTLAVNPSPRESELAPADTLPVEPRPAPPGEEVPRGLQSLLAWVAAVLLAVLAAEAFAVRRRMGVGRRQARLALGARAAVAVLVVGALVGVELPRTRDRVATVFLVDASDSLGPAGRAEAVAWVREALASQPPDAVAGVALFGGDARLELTVQERATLLTPSVQVDAERTDLAGALRLGAAVLPTDARRRIVVVSDGRATEGDTDAEISRLADAGIRVDVHPVARTGGADVAVTELDAPARARQGETVPLEVTVTATAPGPARLTLRQEGTVVDEREVELSAGANVVALPQVAGSSGLDRYSVEVAASGDTVPENDQGFAAVQVEGPPRVLLAEGAPGTGATLAEALRSGGIPTDVVAAEALPALDRLATYQATVLVDVDVRSLAPSQVDDLGAATRDLGRGLVVTGGDHSYALGGYLDSPLEQLLPVVSDVLDPKRRSSVAQVLAIDASGSMGACHCNEGANGLPGGGNFGQEGGVNKTDISRSAAARSIAALSRNDEVGVLAFNTEERWIIDLQQLPPEEVVREGLGRLTPAGGTDVRRSLSTAAEALRESKSRLKHIVLFTDGFTAEGALAGLADQAAALREEGITVSVLGTGEGAAQELRAVADAGGGRFHPGRDLHQIPQIMMEETVLASRNFVNEGEFLPEVVSSAAPVAELRASPPLFGYLATTAKPAARTLLRIGPDGDPLLASWQAGLGRATAWTSDASARWSQAWAGWEGYVPFWAATVKDAFPTGGDGGGLRTSIDGDTLRITVEGADPWPDDATAVARVAGPDRQGREVRLQRTSATTFSGAAAAVGAGSYAVGAAVTAGDGTVFSSATVATQSYSPEYQLGPARPEALRAWSEATGGRGEILADQAFDPADLPAGRGSVPLAGWLLLAAALAWPVAVALSRLRLGRSVLSPVVRGAGALRRRVPSLPGRPGREEAPAPAPPQPVPPPLPDTEPAAPPTTVGRLLERKREGRSPPE
ncbi:MAG TPA: VWA domain-containing protein [Acidimicrobiales bacterium]|nr:VWA domain-containing protein [Acidimicrobiales bacterium]